MTKFFMTVTTGAAVLAGLAVAGSAGAQQAAPATPTQAAPGTRALCPGGAFAGRWTRPDGSVIEITQSGRKLFGSGLRVNQTISARVSGASTASGTYTLRNGSGPFTLTLAADQSSLEYTGRTTNGTPEGPFTWTFRECDPRTVANPVGANLRAVIPAPQLVGAGPASVVAPGIISIGSFRSSRCVLVRVASTVPARTLVTIFSGVRSKRLFGQKLVVFRQPGARSVCIPVPARAKTFNVRTKLGLALGYSKGATPRRGARPNRPTIKPIRLVP